MFDQLANQDFERAFSRAGWRRVLSRLTGENNQLLPYDAVRSRLPIRGQHYIGLHEVPIDQIVGSMGRYNDFDRAFLPTQKRTKDRWISIDKAHYREEYIPPIELYKIGDIFFVKDGNHRVSVCRERGQAYIDAYVTEIDIPIILTADVKIDDLEVKQAQAKFQLSTGLNQVRPDAAIESSIPQVYEQLFEHIQTHRWYLGVEKKTEVNLDIAVASWYDNVYLPVVEIIRDQGLLKSFPGYNEADLYLWIMEYQKYLRNMYSKVEGGEDVARALAAEQVAQNFPQHDIGKLLHVIDRAHWLDEMILNQERANFFEQTCIYDLRPDVKIETTLPGQYSRLIDHIATHRWYLGENRKAEVSYNDAVESWCDHVYLPIIQIIREQDVMKNFPDRTETDLYLWIVKHQWHLREAYGSEIPINQAAQNFSEQFSEKLSTTALAKLVQTVKRRIGIK